jgi:hypothetical protein
MAPRLNSQAAGLERIVAEQTIALAVDEAGRQGQLAKPCGRRLTAVQVDFLLLAREVVGEALQLQRRPAADDDAEFKQGLEGYYRLLPAKLSSGAAINAMGRLLQPRRSTSLSATCRAFQSILT